MRTAIKIGRGLALGCLAMSLVNSVAQAGVTYEGYLSDLTGNAVVSGNAVLRLQVLDPSGVCAIYEEKQNVTTNAFGYFSVQLGGIGAVVTTGFPATNFSSAMANTPTLLTGKSYPSSSGSCNYTPASGDSRNLGVFVNVTGGAEDSLGVLALNESVSALNADKLGGNAVSSFLMTQTGLPNLTQTNFNTLFSTAGWTNLQSVVNGNFVPINGGAATLPANTVLPSTSVTPASPTAGQIWYNSGSGQLQFYNGSMTQTLGTATGSGTVTSVTATAPFVIANGATTPSISMPAATTSVDGYLKATDFNSFNSKLSSALPPGQILIGGASSVATGVSITGDAALTPAGNLSVTGLRGKPVSAAVPTAPGQVLRYDGTLYIPDFIAMSDLRSNITGVQSLSSCLPSQTLTFSSGTDSLACVPISLTGSQVNYTSQPANTFFAAPGAASGVPTFRSLTANDLPASGVAPGTYTSVTVDNYGRVTNGSMPSNLTLPAGGLSVGSGQLYTATGGNVGIGTMSPTSLLDVNGTSHFGGPALHNAGIAIAATPTPSNVVLDLSNAGSAYTSTTHGAYIGANNPSGSQFDYVAFQNNGAQVFKIDYAGNTSVAGGLSTGNIAATGNISASGNISAGSSIILTGTATISAPNLQVSETSAGNLQLGAGLGGTVNVGNALSGYSTVVSLGNVPSGNGNSLISIGNATSRTSTTNVSIGGGAGTGTHTVNLGTTSPAPSLINLNGHVASGPSALPAISCANGALAPNSTDTRGVISFTGTAGTCTITFAQPYGGNPPVCVTSFVGTSVATKLVGAVSTLATLNFGFSAVGSGDKISYICLQ